MKKRSILFIVHAFHNRGGVEGHARTLARGLGEDWDPYFCFPENNHIFLYQGNSEIARWSAPTLGVLTPMRSQLHERILLKVLHEVSPDLIHLLHFVNWPLSIFEILRQTNLPVLSSFHDYYMLSPHYTMQGFELSTSCTSAEYSKRVFGKDISPYLQARRKLLTSSLKHISTKIIPSAFLERVLQHDFPGEYTQVPYGIDPFAVDRSTNSDRPLRFGYFGSLLPQKGWNLLLKAFINTPEIHSKSELHFYGGSAEIPSNIENVFFHGHYNSSDLSTMCANTDVGVIPSRFAETFCIVLSEMWHAGIPVAAAEIGALGERIKDAGVGRLFQPDNVASLQESLRYFLDENVWRSWEAPPVPTSEQMCRKLHQLYEHALSL